MKKGTKARAAAIEIQRKAETTEVVQSYSTGPSTTTKTLSATSDVGASSATSDGTLSDEGSRASKLMTSVRRGGRRILLRMTKSRTAPRGAGDRRTFNLSSAATTAGCAASGNTTATSNWEEDDETELELGGDVVKDTDCKRRLTARKTTAAGELQPLKVAADSGQNYGVVRHVTRTSSEKPASTNQDSTANNILTPSFHPLSPSQASQSTLPSPTKLPSLSPTQSPTPPPTRSPSKSPTLSPTQSPTMSLTQSSTHSATQTTGRVPRPVGAIVYSVITELRHDGNGCPGDSSSSDGGTLTTRTLLAPPVARVSASSAAVSAAGTAAAATTAKREKSFTSRERKATTTLAIVLG